MKPLSVVIVMATFLGGFSFGGQGAAAYLYAQGHTTRRPPPPLVAHDTAGLELLHEMSTAAAEPELESALDSSPASPAFARFDDASAKRQLAEIVTTVGLCRVQGDTRGASSAIVVFGDDGAVLRVTLDAPYYGTPIGACVARRFAHAHVARFDGDLQGIRVAFRI
jgi:hypothetical protein